MNGLRKGVARGGVALSADVVADVFVDLSRRLCSNFVVQICIPESSGCAVDVALCLWLKKSILA